MRIALLLTAAMLATPAAHASFFVTYEAPGVQNTGATFDFVGVETFESRSTGAGQTFSTNFGTGGVISGTYTGVRIDGANQFGSAGGVGNHAVTFDTTGYSLDLTTTDPRGINYFGFWLSALDRGNQLQLFRGGSLVFSFDPQDVLDAIGDDDDYFGNPTGPFLGQNNDEPYAFVNIFGRGGSTFDRVVFFEDPTVGGYESDNHTVGFFTDDSGTPVPAPATLALFGLGAMLMAGARRR